jgi:FkbM family methyltransferase
MSGVSTKLFVDIVHPFYGDFRVITKDLGISKWIIEKYIWEEHILNIICKYIKPDSTIIDIGANIGTHTVGIIKHITAKNITGIKVKAFEPQPFIYSILNQNVQYTKSESTIQTSLYNFGLSDSESTIYMTMPDYNVVENPGGYGLDFNTQKDLEKTEIHIKTLDSFGFTNVCFMKIDVEGHENQVLKGAIETIKKSKPVMIIEILGGVTLNTASISEIKYINDTKEFIKSLNYNVDLIANSDYLCIPK